ncbi:putative uncharacterized protein C8orf44 [Plecturocebus cupreus]
MIRVSHHALLILCLKSGISLKGPNNVLMLIDFHRSKSYTAEMRFHHIGQTGLKLLTLGDPAASASQSAGITGEAEARESLELGREKLQDSLTLSPRVKCSGAFMTHYILNLLGSKDPPTLGAPAAGITGTRHHTQLIKKLFFVHMGSRFVAQATSNCWTRGILLLQPLKFHSCCPGWSGMAQSRFTTTSASRVQTGFLHVVKAGLELPTSGDLSVSASQSAGMTALWESKMGRSIEVRSSRPAWPTWRNPISTKNTKLSQGWWYVPVIPANWEAKSQESLEPGDGGCNHPYPEEESQMHPQEQHTRETATGPQALHYLALLSRLQCSGATMAHSSLNLLGSSMILLPQPSQQPGVQKQGSHYVVQAGLELGSRDLPTLASQSVGIRTNPHQTVAPLSPPRKLIQGVPYKKPGHQKPLHGKTTENDAQEEKPHCASSLLPKSLQPKQRRNTSKSPWFQPDQRQGFTVLVQLVSNSEPQVIRLPQPPKVLGLQAQQVAGVSEEAEQVLHRSSEILPLPHQPINVTLPLPNTLDGILPPIPSFPNKQPSGGSAGDLGGACECWTLRVVGVDPGQWNFGERLLLSSAHHAAAPAEAKGITNTSSSFHTAIPYLLLLHQRIFALKIHADVCELLKLCFLLLQPCGSFSMSTVIGLPELEQTLGLLQLQKYNARTLLGLALLPRLECRGTISAHCSLDVLGLSDPPTSAPASSYDYRASTNEKGTHSNKMTGKCKAGVNATLFGRLRQENRLNPEAEAVVSRDQPLPSTWASRAKLCLQKKKRKEKKEKEKREVGEEFLIDGFTMLVRLVLNSRPQVIHLSWPPKCLDYRQMGSRYVAKAVIELASSDPPTSASQSAEITGSGDPPASASQVAAITRVYHHTQLIFPIFGKGHYGASSLNTEMNEASNNVATPLRGRKVGAAYLSFSGLQLKSSLEKVF